MCACKACLTRGMQAQQCYLTRTSGRKKGFELNVNHSRVWHADDPTPADGEVVPLQSIVQQSGPYSDFKAIVAGATGGTGQAIVRRLITEGVPVRALVRDTSKAVSRSLQPQACMRSCSCIQHNAQCSSFSSACACRMLHCICLLGHRV